MVETDAATCHYDDDEGFVLSKRRKWLESNLQKNEVLLYFIAVPQFPAERL